MSENTVKHPIQPLELDGRGTLRFKENSLVRYILDNGGIDMNQLALNSHLFSQEDREQFAELIGYSLSGFGELSYVTDNTIITAERMYEEGESQLEAENKVLKETIKKLKKDSKDFIVELYGIHPDDLTDRW